jgi:hypothetical protein
MHSSSYATTTSLHAQAVLEMLSSRLHGGATRPEEITTPFGVALKAAPGGRVAIGDQVLAPGIDDCSPKAPAEVMYIGTRPDRPGNWCLLRYRGQAQPGALITEDALEARWVGARGAGARVAASWRS